MLIVLASMLGNSGYAQEGRGGVAQSTISYDAQAEIQRLNERVGGLDRVLAEANTAHQRLSVDLERARSELKGLEDRIARAQSFDSKIANAAYFIAAAIAFLPAIAAVIGFFSWRLHERVDGRLIAQEKELGQRMSNSEREIDERFSRRGQEIHRLLSSELTEFVTSEVREHINGSIRSELRSIVSDIESDYATAMGKIEDALLSFQLNDAKKFEVAGAGKAIEAYLIYRALLMRVLTGDMKSATGALGRLREEFVEKIGPTSKFYLSAFLTQMREHGGFARREVDELVSGICRECDRARPKRIE